MGLAIVVQLYRMFMERQAAKAQAKADMKFPVLDL